MNEKDRDRLNSAFENIDESYIQEASAPPKGRAAAVRMRAVAACLAAVLLLLPIVKLMLKNGGFIEYPHSSGVESTSSSPHSSPESPPESSEPLPPPDIVEGNTCGDVYVASDSGRIKTLPLLVKDEKFDAASGRIVTLTGAGAENSISSNTGKMRGLRSADSISLTLPPNASLRAIRLYDANYDYVGDVESLPALSELTKGSRWYVVLEIHFTGEYSEELGRRTEGLYHHLFYYYADPREKDLHGDVGFSFDGDTDIAASKYLVSLEEYDPAKDEFSVADIPQKDITELLADVCHTLPTVYCDINGFLSVSYSGTLTETRVYDSELKLTDLSREHLPTGEWYIVCRVERKGNYVSNHSRYERSVYDHLIKVVSLPVLYENITVSTNTASAVGALKILKYRETHTANGVIIKYGDPIETALRCHESELRTLYLGSQSTSIIYSGMPEKIRKVYVYDSSFRLMASGTDLSCVNDASINGDVYVAVEAEYTGMLSEHTGKHEKSEYYYAFKIHPSFGTSTSSHSLSGTVSATDGGGTVNAAAFLIKEEKYNYIDKKWTYKRGDGAYYGILRSPDGIPTVRGRDFSLSKPDNASITSVTVYGPELGEAVHSGIDLACLDLLDVGEWYVIMRVSFKGVSLYPLSFEHESSVYEYAFRIVIDGVGEIMPEKQLDADEISFIRLYEDGLIKNDKILVSREKIEAVTALLSGIRLYPAIHIYEIPEGDSAYNIEVHFTDGRSMTLSRAYENFYISDTDDARHKYRHYSLESGERIRLQSTLDAISSDLPTAESFGSVITVLPHLGENGKPVHQVTSEETLSELARLTNELYGHLSTVSGDSINGDEWSMSVTHTDGTSATLFFRGLEYVRAGESEWMLIDPTAGFTVWQIINVLAADMAQTSFTADNVFDAVTLGMTAEQIKNILGEPVTEDGNRFILADGTVLKVDFSDERLSGASVHRIISAPEGSSDPHNGRLAILMSVDKFQSGTY